MDWLRLYNEIISDRKLRRLPPAQRWLWIAVLVAARLSPKPGTLLLSDNVAVTDADLADLAAIPARDVKKGIIAFLGQEMLAIDDAGAYVVKNWNKRQFAGDNSTVRSQKARGKQRPRHVAATLQEQVRDVPETLPSRARPTDTDTDTELTPLPPEEESGYGQLDELFDQFWDVFPERKGPKRGPKDEVKTRFSKVPVKEWPFVVKAARNYAKFCREAEEFPVDPIRFFWSRECTGGLWREYRDPVPVKPSKNGHGPPDLSRTEVPQQGFSWEQCEDGCWKPMARDPDTGLYPHGCSTLSEAMAKDEEEAEKRMGRSSVA